jgi:hypothetical protein
MLLLEVQMLQQFSGISGEGLDDEEAWITVFPFFGSVGICLFIDLGLRL